MSNINNGKPISPPNYSISSSPPSQGDASIISTLDKARRQESVRHAARLTDSPITGLRNPRNHPANNIDLKKLNSVKKISRLELAEMQCNRWSKNLEKMLDPDKSTMVPHTATINNFELIVERLKNAGGTPSRKITILLNQARQIKPALNSVTELKKYVNNIINKERVEWDTALAGLNSHLTDAHEKLQIKDSNDFKIPRALEEEGKKTTDLANKVYNYGESLLKLKGTIDMFNISNIMQWRHIENTEYLKGCLTDAMTASHSLSNSGIKLSQHQINTLTELTTLADNLLSSSTTVRNLSNLCNQMERTDNENLPELYPKAQHALDKFKHDIGKLLESYPQLAPENSSRYDYDRLSMGTEKAIDLAQSIEKEGVNPETKEKKREIRIKLANKITLNKEDFDVIFSSKNTQNTRRLAYEAMKNNKGIILDPETKSIDQEASKDILKEYAKIILSPHNPNINETVKENLLSELIQKKGNEFNEGKFDGYDLNLMLFCW